MIKKPTLIIDKERCVKNIRFMAQKASRNNTDLRPHFKTHQQAEVGKWFVEEGIEKATVSSVSMARYFADNGWNDITIAFPVNILEIEEINELARKVRLNLLLESAYSTQFLKDNLTHNVGIFIKIDVGTKRTGIDPENSGLIESIFDIIDESPEMMFKGFLAHAGHSYSCKGNEEISSVYNEAIFILQKLKRKYHQRYTDLIISYGDTPTCSIIEDFSAIDEIRAGNFVFYDVTQWQIGSCEIKDIAVVVECPIVALHPQRNEVVIYGGGIHFSKDRIELEGFGTIYGIPVYHRGEGWGEIIQGAFLKRVSQEHGIVAMKAEDISVLSIGDTIKILPVHSCMAADLLRNDVEFKIN